jgi:hypothetical protein
MNPGRRSENRRKRKRKRDSEEQVRQARRLSINSKE